MCLAKAFIDDEAKPVAEEITSIKREDGGLLVTTLFGEKIELAAAIREIDFRSSRVVLEKTAGGG
jgi:predicted RNA-binding protein